MNIDAYKLSHKEQYPAGTEYVYSNFTPRGSRIKDVDHVVFFGLQAFIDELEETYRTEFFNKDIDQICTEFEANLESMIGPNNVGTQHWRDLHELGYLPLRFKALPEGTQVPLRVPMFTVENTLPEFFWLTNYIESWASVGVWIPSTAATQALHMRNQLLYWSRKTTGTDEVDLQAHDFSFRGMGSISESVAVGAAHLLSFTGSDTVQARSWITEHYSDATEPLLLTIPATEHSVMCAGGADGEYDTYKRLLDTYLSGPLAIVSDTYDLWNVLTNILPSLKPQIMQRDGVLVVRPDSGNPADILCGTGGNSPEGKGVIELLWQEFGGTINDYGYKVLDSHVGAVYGDSINIDTANEICRRLDAKGFASTNVTLGLGSYYYHYVTRDTFGFAMKATNVVINGKDKAIFKDPITDNGLKRSARGRLVVINNGDYELIDNLDQKAQQELADIDHLQTVYENGEWFVRHSYDEIRRRVRA